MAGYSKVVVGDRNTLHAEIVDFNRHGRFGAEDISEADLAENLDLLCREFRIDGLRPLVSFPYTILIPGSEENEHQERIVFLVEPID